MSLWIGAKKRLKLVYSHYHRWRSLHLPIVFGYSSPIIVYQMGKVGSTSIVNSLKKYGLTAYHVHRINPQNIESVRLEHLRKGKSPPDETLGLRLHKYIKQGKKLKIITLVREPIGRNISAFFQNFEVFAGIKYTNSKFSAEELADKFIAEYNHSVPLTWFDVEIRETLGIDIYKYPFPKERGYVRIKRHQFDILILKSEIDDSVKEKCIMEYLGLDEFKIIRENVGKNKEYYITYRQFLDAIMLPECYLEMMCNSKYTKHFYSHSDIQHIRLKWSNGDR